MDYLELMKIKAYQKEFKDLFGKELVIDFSAMKGIKEVVYIGRVKKPFDSIKAENILINLCEKHGADIKLIKGKTKRLSFNCPIEIFVIGQYIQECLRKKWGLKHIMNHINRERSGAYFYNKKFGIFNK
jgi:hypothetical protein